MLALNVDVVYFLVGMLPVFGLLLQYIPLNGKKWFYLATASILSLILGFYLPTPYYSPSGNTEYYYVPKHLYIVYGIFLGLVLCGFVLKYGYTFFGKLLGLSFLLTHVSTEYWEIPVFVYGHLGLFGKHYAGSINQVYLIASFCLLIYFSKFIFNKKSIAILIAPVLTSFIVITLYPEVTYTGSIWLIARFVTYVCLGLAFLRWSKIS